MQATSFAQYVGKKADLLNASNTERKRVYEPIQQIAWHSGSMWVKAPIMHIFVGKCGHFALRPNPRVEIKYIRQFAVMSAFASRQQLLNVIRHKRHTLLVHGIAAVTYANTPKSPTDAEGRYIHHPDFSHAAVSFEYRDFVQWNDENHTCTVYALKKTSQ